MGNPLPPICIAALLLVATLPARAADAPPTKVELRSTQAVLSNYSSKVRSSVLKAWKSPALERTTTIRIKGTVDEQGKLNAVETSISPPLSAENEQKLRESLQEALGQTFATPPGGEAAPVEFKLVAQNGPFFGSCFPLKVYVPTAFADSSSTMIPDTSVSALTQGIIRWNRALAERSGGKVSEAFVIVSNPEQAAMRIDAYQTMPQFGPYFEDSASGQMIVRVGLMQPSGGALQGGMRLIQRLPITHQAMFQIGRMLGLGPSAEQNDVLWPAPSPVDTRIKTDYASTKDVQVAFARSADVTVGVSQGITGSQGKSAAPITTSVSINNPGVDVTDMPMIDRSFKPEQLDDVLKRIGENGCR